jgi:hypothetical protein
MAPFGSHRTIGLMNKPDEQTSGKEAQEPEPSRLEEARLIIEQYADDLREIIKKLRQRLN